MRIQTGSDFRKGQRRLTLRHCSCDCGARGCDKLSHLKGPFCSQRCDLVHKAPSVPAFKIAATDKGRTPSPEFRCLPYLKVRDRPALPQVQRSRSLCAGLRSHAARNAFFAASSVATLPTREIRRFEGFRCLSEARLR